MAFPATRLRRLRRTPCCATSSARPVSRAADLVQPLFVAAGLDGREPIEAMPGVEPALDLARSSTRPARPRRSASRPCCCSASPPTRTRRARGACDDEGIVQLAARAIKEAHPDLLVITDVCLCEYTTHGHCGVLRDDGERRQRRDARAARADRGLATPRAGADVVAPSDMMDGRVGAIRAALDEEGFTDIADHRLQRQVRLRLLRPVPRGRRTRRPPFGDRRGYQMDPANAREAVREAQLDVEEGADIVMVKPALPYLDVIRRVTDATDAARRRLQRQRRVRDAEGGRRSRAGSTSAPPCSRR